ncbi:MAG: phosphate signaling complex protein PhoU [Proteobacteria bacterium]|nr:phosphate signaling complex protein PhoU [Pseudomonadota bacterium]
MIERHFDEELQKLNSKLLKMASLSEESIYLAIEALKNRNKELAQNVIDNDIKIDEFELEIEDYSIELLAKRQPLASDLRFIATGMRINSELERIADLSVNIAHRARDLSKEPALKVLVHIPMLSDLAIKMVKGSIDSFVNRDLDAAKNVIKLDSEANNLRTEIHKKLVEEYMTKDVTTIPRSLSLFLVAQHLERMCDHAKYIAEDVIYLVSAKNVKHKHEEILK